MADDALTPDSFMAGQGDAAPALTPDRFMASPDAHAQDQAKPGASGQQPDWWDRVKGAAEAVPSVFDALTNKSTQLANTPLVPESVMPGPAKTVPGGIARGAAEFARGMTSPENIGLMFTGGTLGAVSKYLPRALSAVFGTQMLADAYNRIPEVKAALDRHDAPAAAEAITKGVASGLLGVAASAHAALDGGGAEGRPVPETSPVEKATESARAGVEALTPDGFMEEQGAASAPIASESSTGEVQSSAEPPVLTGAPETASDRTLTPDAYMQEKERAGAPPELSGREVQPMKSASQLVAEIQQADAAETPDGFMASQAAVPAESGPRVENSEDVEPAGPRQPSTPPAYGRQSTILVPGETTTYPARFAVRELPDVQPSHNAFSFEANPNYEPTNDRDYSRSGNAARVVQQSAPDTFNPDFLTADSPTAEHGAPIIDQNGNVLGGNSRTMTLARVYQRGGPDAAMYRQSIEAKAAQFALDPADLARFDKPILVREVDGGVDAQRAITDFNKAAAAELTPEERAVSDGRRLSPETIAKIGANLGDLGEEGTLATALRGDNGTEILNSLVKDGVLTDQEKGGYLDDKGNLTPDAKARIGRALVGRMFETPAEFRETTPSMRGKLERIAPQLLRVEGRPDWSLTDTTRQAIALVEDARVHKMPIEDAARQSVVGAERSYSPDAIAMAKTLEQGPMKAAGAFRRYANDEALSREGSQSAFFAPPTRLEAFRDAFSAPKPTELLHSTTGPRAISILNSGEIRPSEYASGTAVSMATRPAAHAGAHQVTFVIDPAKVTTTPFDLWGKGASDPLFEFEQRSEKGVPRSAIREIRINPNATYAGSGREPLSPRGIATIQRVAEKYGIPVRIGVENPGDLPAHAGERGGISPDLLSLGADKFVREDVIPAAKRVASDLVEAKDDVMRVVAPQTRGGAAEFTGLQLRQRMAQFARRFDQGEQRLRDARRFFNTRTPEQNYDFIDDVEHGLGRGKQGELEPIARMFSRMLDQRRNEVQALGEGALKGYYQNYFPHIFERPEDASKFVDSFFSGKRSMEGPKSFLKHREFPTFREALDAGLKPVSDNPVDLVVMKAREMDRYLLAHAVLRDLAENGIAKRVSGLGADARQQEMLGGAPLRPEWSVETRDDLPPEFVSIRDPVGGGRWYASEGAADVLNNFLSPGLRGRSGMFRTLLGVNNVMNQANLGLSAFHLRAVTSSSMAARMGLGVVKALEGHPADAAFHIFTSPAAPFIDFIKGSRVLHDWFKPGSEGAPVAAMTDALMKGGGRARMDAFYQNAMADKMMAAFRRGNFIGGALRSPFAAIEATSKPLMNYLVPRMKLGAFADMAQHELEKLGPGAKVVDVQRAMSAAWDHVENRLGQMTYDNRFWSRTFKDIAMLSVRSVGWNLGDFLEAKSAIGAVKQAVTLKRPADLHGLGFVVGYTMTAALMGAIMQYLHTGQGPQQLRDYFFPKREDGRRVVAAPYVKDAYQFARDPSRTIENKASPLISTMSEMFHDRDYYDRPIRNSDDPLVKQMEQEAAFVGRQFLPFTLQQFADRSPKKQRPLPGGNTFEHKAENFFGITAAPAPLQPGYRPRRTTR